MNDKTFLNLILADDDPDDCMFFKDALEELELSTQFSTVHDGEQLMQLLTTNTGEPFHVLFLDLNMPRKNGFECLSEIKSSEKLKHLPVIIISTSYDEEKANQLYDSGAHNYICKPSDFSQLKKVIQMAMLLVQQNSEPSKEKFLLNKLISAY